MIVPRLPLGARAINAIGRPIMRALPQLSLREDSLFAAARAQTGLDDFGDDAFREGLRRLLASLEGEADLTPIGRMIARGEAVQALVNRLEMNDWRRRHPEIERETIRAPLIIIGMPRTGTTILHELLMQDPTNRVPQTWEVDFPCPPPQSETYLTDPRIEKVRAVLDRSESLIPDFKRMHRMGAQLPQECVRILTPEFTSIASLITYRVPSYGDWLLNQCDWAPAYAGHHRFLQLLQWRCPGERWVLKTPGHLWALPALLAQYPDACLVQTHRDPLRILGSVTSLGTTLRTMAGRRPDPQEIAREWSTWHAQALDLSVDARESGVISADRVIDIHFAEFMADPFTAIRHIYDRFHIEYREVADSRMRAYLYANQSDKHGAHEYSFADTGLDVARERAAVRRYQEYFGVRSEPL
jgi:hypothetical protein